MIFCSIFSRLDSFPQVFGQVKEWLMLDLHEIIRVPHVVACPMDCHLPCDGGQQGGVLKFMKNDHVLVFLAVWVFFSKFFGQVKE